MTRLDSSQAAAALRAEIERAARLARRLRVSVCGLVAVSMAGCSVYIMNNPEALRGWLLPKTGCFMWRIYSPSEQVVECLHALMWGVVPGCLMGGAVALVYRLACSRRFRVAANRLPREQVLSELLPLLNDGSEAGKMATAVLRHWRSDGAEVAPAPSPEGRGDEASPAE